MLQNDRQIIISAASSRKATNWPAQTLFWSEFLDRIKPPPKSAETLVEYLNLPKQRQDELKDVGGFVGGELKDGRRKAANVESRYLITLDLDRIPAGGTQDVLRRVDAMGCAYGVYSTRKHEEARPRLRVIFPLHRPATGEEYEPLSRKMAEFIGIELCDPTTFEAHRLMYWPSCCSDSQYVFVHGDKPFLDTDELLKKYNDWRNISEWPQCVGQEQARNKEIAKQGDPTEKKGIIGAFCRVYDVYRAMGELIPDEYEPCVQEGRYTFTGGSTAGGAIVYEDGKFLYSHHATDPAGGKLSNAFDLVRLHKFGTLDDNAPANTFGRNLPSFKAMCEFAVNDSEVTKLMAQEDFGEIGTETPQTENAEESADWIEQLTRDTNGAYNKTINNTLLIVGHAPELHGCALKDAFANRIYTSEGLPWRSDTGYWSDSDTTNLRAYLETRFRYKPGKQDVKDAIIAIAVKRQFHPVREYLESLTWDGVPRVDTLFVDYLGVADSAYTRAVTRKALAGAVARIMNPGCKFDYMLVFVGKQGRGKSSMVYKLAGGDDWFTDSVVTFDGSRAFEAVTGKWLVEVPEMHAFDKATMNQAKAFISKQSDFYRAAYAEFPEDRRRQCVFFGTTNNRDCLRDDTGGRRFWTLDTDAIPRTKNIFTDLDEERDQIWAEAVMRWSLGEPLFLPQDLETVAAEVQEDHREVHPWESTIANFVEKNIPIDWPDWTLNQRMQFWGDGIVANTETTQRNWVCVREIWQEALNMPLAQLDPQKARAIGSVLNRLPGWERGGTHRFGKEYEVQKGFKRIGSFT